MSALVLFGIVWMRVKTLTSPKFPRFGNSKARMIVLALKLMEFHWLKYSERQGKYQVAMLDDLDACGRCRRRRKEHIGFLFTKAAESLPQNLSETPVEINEAGSRTLPGIRFALVMRSNAHLFCRCCFAQLVRFFSSQDLTLTDFAAWSWGRRTNKVRMFMALSPTEHNIRKLQCSDLLQLSAFL